MANEDRGPVGVILTTDDPERLYVAATYVATELARGRDVVVFAAGRSVLAFSGEEPRGEVLERMKRMKVHWRTLLEESRNVAKAVGLVFEIMACETAVKIYQPAKLELVDSVGSMYSFLERVDSVVAF